MCLLVRAVDWFRGWLLACLMRKLKIWRGISENWKILQKFWTLDRFSMRSSSGWLTSCASLSFPIKFPSWRPCCQVFLIPATTSCFIQRSSFQLRSDRLFSVSQPVFVFLIWIRKVSLSSCGWPRLVRFAWNTKRPTVSISRQKLGIRWTERNWHSSRLLLEQKSNRNFRLICWKIRNQVASKTYANSFRMQQSTFS